MKTIFLVSLLSMGFINTAFGAESPLTFCFHNYNQITGLEPWDACLDFSNAEHLGWVHRGTKLSIRVHKLYGPDYKEQLWDRLEGEVVDESGVGIYRLQIVGEGQIFKANISLEIFNGSRIARHRIELLDEQAGMSYLFGYWPQEPGFPCRPGHCH